MAIIKVAGLDPSMSNFGMVKGNLDLISGVFQLEEMLLAETTSDKKNNKTVRKNSDDLNRARILTNDLTNFLGDVRLAFVEIPVGSQTARAMASYGLCIGILAGVTIPLIQVTPTEVKVVATGKKTATKQNMIDWAVKQYPDACWLTKKQKGVISLVSKNEHLADAVATIHAGVLTDEFNTAKTFLISQHN